MEKYTNTTTVYTYDNRFVILLSRVYFSDGVTEIRHFGPLKTNEILHNSEHWLCMYLVDENTFVFFMYDIFVRVTFTTDLVW